MNILKNKDYCKCNLALSKHGKCQSCFKLLSPLATELNLDKLKKRLQNKQIKIHELFEVN